jgi:hypothetical protein
MYKFISLASISRFLIIFLFSVLPFWEVVVSQIDYFLGNKDLFASFRYFFKFLLIIILFILLVKNYSILKFKTFYLFLLLTFFYYLFHIFGESNYFLILDGLRYELIFFLISILIILNRSVIFNYSVLPNIDILIKIVFIQGIIVIVFSLWQLWDISILEFIYRRPLEEMRNIKLAIGYRLVSLLVNPINLGAFLIIFWLSIFFYYQKNNSLKRFFFYLFFTFLCFILIIGTLSRLALLTFVFVFLTMNFIYSIYNKRNFILFSSIVFFSLLFVVSYIEDYSLVFTRFESLNNSTEYTSDSRVSNWNRAFGSLSNINYLWGMGIGISSPDSDKVSNYNALMIENSFISIFLQYGLIGFIFYCIIIFKFFINIIRIKPLYNLYFYFLLGFLLLFVFMSFGNDFQRNLPFVFYFWIFYSVSESFVNFKI